MKQYSLLLVLGLILTAAAAQGCGTPECQGKVCAFFFYGEGCPHCAQVEPFINELGSKYSEKMNIHRLEIYHNLKNYQMFNEFCVNEGVSPEKRGVPMVVIGSHYLIGVDQIRNNLEGIIQTCTLESCSCPFLEQGVCQQVEYNSTEVSPSILGLQSGISLPLIIGSGLVDGINPCAFAVLIFLVSYILEVSESKLRMVKAGLAYISAVYVSYLLAGLGILTVIQVSGISSIIYMAAALVAILAGLVNVKDFFWYGKGISLQIPKSMKPTIHKWTQKANIPAAIILGFLVSMFELPCTGGVYLAILALLSGKTTQLSALPYLLIYNVMFVLPLLLILGAVYYGMEVEHLKSWKEAKKNWMKLGIGLLLLVLGIGMFLGWF